MIKKGKEKKFQEYVTVLKSDYDRWRIKREFREHNPIYTELLNIKNEIAGLDKRPQLAYEEKLRLDAILRNRFASLRAQLPARDPFALPAVVAAAEKKSKGRFSHKQRPNPGQCCAYVNPALVKRRRGY